MIELEHLTKRFGDVVAVNDLTLDIGDGEFFGLLGPNGAGKTTTLLMLTTLVRPMSGAARVNGFDLVRAAGQVRRSIGIVFQDPSSDDTLTGYENLKLHGMLYGMAPALREKRIEEVLALVDLADRRDDIVKHYSGGMRRRLELARGLMHRPKVLFLDEPTLGLDPQSREHIWAYVERLVREERITVVLTTNYMEETDRLCSRLAIIDRGSVVALDSPERLKRVLGGDVVTLGVREPNLDAVRALGGSTGSSNARAWCSSRCAMPGTGSPDHAGHRRGRVRGRAAGLARRRVHALHGAGDARVGRGGRMGGAIDALQVRREIGGIGAIWYREWKVFLREKSRIVASVMNPILWLLVFGGGLGRNVSIPGTEYQAFIYPGILAQSVLFSSIFFGVYIVWDRKIDFLKEVLVAPLSRTSVFLGKVVGGATDSVVQSVILLALGAILGGTGVIPGLHLTAWSFAMALLILALTTAALVSVGLIIGARMSMRCAT